MAQETTQEALKGSVAVCIVFLVLNTFFVILRFIARFRLKQSKLGWDDILIIAGYFANVGLCADALVIYHYETIGNPPADQPLDMPWQIETQLVPTLKAIYAAEQLLYAGFTFPKLSMLFLYLRVFEARWSRIAAWVLIGITTACWIAFSLTAAFLCQPVSYYWDRLLPGGHCINIDTFWRAIPPFNIVTDIAALILPIPVVWKLEASKMKKLGVIFIFFTGGIGLITCCVRWGVYLTHSAQQIIPTVTGPMLSWAIVEAGVYEIAACLPMMRPVLIAITPRWLISKWTAANDSSAAYHLGKNSSKRASGQILGGRAPKNFSRLPDSAHVFSTYSPTEKGPRSDAAASRIFPLAKDDIPLQDFPQGDGDIHRKVDVTVTQSPIQ